MLVLDIGVSWGRDPFLGEAGRQIGTAGELAAIHVTNQMLGLRVVVGIGGAQFVQGAVNHGV